MQENWKSIPGFDKYEVSTLGNIRNAKTKRHLAKFQAHNGYERMTLRKDGKYASIDVHRCVALAFLDNPENKRTVNHKNRVRNDNRVENLEWATYQEQAVHAQGEYIDQYSSQYFKPNSIEGEQWRNVIGHDGYEVSDYGSVRNQYKKLRTLTQDGRGYISVNIQGKVYSMHRLVAKMFLPNFTDDCVVNHKDGNKSNNHTSNLQVTTQSVNATHSYGIGRNTRAKVQALQVDYRGIIVGSFDSIADAEAATGFNRGSIHYALQENGTCGGYRWYKNFDDYEKDKDNIFSSIFKVFQHAMDGTFIAMYDGFVEAEQATGICKANINRAVNRNKESLLTTGGYIWTSTRAPKTAALDKLRNEQNA